ncbi:LPXTG cell wall anchor domain-containing protein, partial [Streptococcus mitis]|uniref:SIALI-17 repeat-containing surface protein n=1 Tax=Streptococcus mitis TaxID=28037 RepID=UPI0039C2BCC3
EPTNANHLRLVSILPEGAKARVQVRTLKDGQESWTDLGAITSGLQTFAIRNGGSLLDVKLVWEGGKAEFYELASFYQELTEEPVQSSKGEEPAPVLEVPEFTGGVNAVEALVNEVPEYTGPLSTVGGQTAPTVEKPEFKLSSLEKTQTLEALVQVAKEDKRLPETGEKQSETAIFLASVGLALSAIFVAKSKKEIDLFLEK